MGGSRFRGNEGRGRGARAFWIPAYAGMTVIMGGAGRLMAIVIMDGAVGGGGIPAYAGMTGWVAALTARG